MEETRLTKWKNRYSTLTRVFELVNAGVILLYFQFQFTHWEKVPDTIPTHFNAAGRADAWGSKDTFIVLPIMTIVLYLIFTIISIFPEKGNTPFTLTEENRERQYRIIFSLLCWLKLELVLMTSWLGWRILEIGMGREQDLGSAFLPLVLVGILGTLGWFIYRMYQER